METKGSHRPLERHTTTVQYETVNKTNVQQLHTKQQKAERQFDEVREKALITYLKEQHPSNRSSLRLVSIPPP